VAETTRAPTARQGNTVKEPTTSLRFSASRFRTTARCRAREAIGAVHSRRRRFSRWLTLVRRSLRPPSGLLTSGWYRRCGVAASSDRAFTHRPAHQRHGGCAPGL
jgi:hypothetical protein